jgi:hypothetical protein
MNNKLVTAVLCFGSHICNQAARIRVNFNPGGYIKRTLTGSIKFILTSIFEERGVGNGHISVDFIFMNLYGLCTYPFFCCENVKISILNF